MKNVLVTIPWSPGFIGPIALICKDLAALGYNPIVVTPTYRNNPLKGFEFVAAPNDYLLDISNWHDHDTIFETYRFHSKIVKELQIDILLTTQFSPSYALIAKLTKMPVVVLTGFSPLWPAPQDALANSQIGKIQTWRLASWRKKVDAVAARIGIREDVERKHYYGSAVIVRNIECLYGLVGNELPNFHFLGSMVNHQNNECVTQIETSSNRNKTIYFQHGRAFDDKYAWDLLYLLSQELGFRVVVDLARFDGNHRPKGLVGVEYFDGGCEIQSIAEELVLVVSGGGSTPVLAALEFGVPQLIYQSSSGSEDIIAILEPLGLCSYVNINGHLESSDVASKIKTLNALGPQNLRSRISKKFLHKRGQREDLVRSIFESL